MTANTEVWEGTSVTPLQLMTQIQVNMALVSMLFHVSIRCPDKYHDFASYASSAAYVGCF